MCLIGHPGLNEYALFCKALYMFCNQRVGLTRVLQIQVGEI